MKKQLLTTTALIAAGLLAGGGGAYAQANGPAQKGKPVLTIGGWVEGIVATAHENHHSNAGIGTRVGWDSQYDSEFHFLGSVTLDNGIKIRSHAELEGDVSGDQGDQARSEFSMDRCGWLYHDDHLVLSAHHFPSTSGADSQN